MISPERGRNSTLTYMLFMCPTTFLVCKNKGRKWPNFYSIFKVLQIFFATVSAYPLNFARIRSTFLCNSHKVLIFTAHSTKKAKKHFTHHLFACECCFVQSLIVKMYASGEYTHLCHLSTDFYLTCHILETKVRGALWAVLLNLWWRGSALWRHQL